MPSKPESCKGCLDYFPYIDDDDGGVEIPADCCKGHIHEARNNTGCDEHTSYHPVCETCIALPVCGTDVSLYDQKCALFLKNLRSIIRS